jgi:hypothetical protein
MQVSSIEKYPRYVVDVEHEEATYTVHISEDAIYDEHFITNLDTSDDIPQSHPLYKELLDAAYSGIHASKDTFGREDLLKIASIANPGVMSTPEMLFERLGKIHALVIDLLQNTKTA